MCTRGDIGPSTSALASARDRASTFRVRYFWCVCVCERRHRHTLRLARATRQRRRVSADTRRRPRVRWAFPLSARSMRSRQARLLPQM